MVRVSTPATAASAAAHTRAYGVEINAHAWSSAIVTAASLALSLSTPNCKQIEVKPLRNPMQHELAREEMGRAA